MVCDKFLTFNNGHKMPALGIGTWQAPEDEVELSINLALEAGYRHIDAAPIYKNEHVIGRVLKKWFDSGKLTREELFVTTKLPPNALRPDLVEAFIKKSLADLQLSYVDLYLIHVPFGILADSNGDYQKDGYGVVPDPNADYLAVWKSMEGLINKGLTKSIGLSNFNKRQIQLVLNNCYIAPVNLQIEHHVYLQQKDLIAFCKKNKITVTAYAPLGSRDVTKLNKASGIDRQLPALMDIPEVKKIAKAHNKSPAQVLLRWIIERGLAAIPKSTNPERLKQNLDIFDFSLSEEEIEKMNGLDANFRVVNFSFIPGAEQLPEYPF